MRLECTPNNARTQPANTRSVFKFQFQVSSFSFKFQVSSFSFKVQFRLYVWCYQQGFCSRLLHPESGLGAPWHRGPKSGDCLADTTVGRRCRAGCPRRERACAHMFLPGAKKGTHESPWDTGGGYLRLAAGVSALAGLDAVLIWRWRFSICWR